MDGLRVGVVGLGLGSHYVSEYDSDARVAEVVLCDPEAGRRSTAAAGATKARDGYATIESMLDAERLDAVTVVTPDHLHRAHVETALEAGAHVLVTKPLATTLEDGRAMVLAADRADRKLMVAHETRLRDGMRRIRALIQAGALGDLVHVRLDHYENKVESFRIASWYADVATGRTVMVGTAIHELDAIRYLTGREVTSVYALGNRAGDLEFHGDKTIVAVFSLEGGVLAQVTGSYVAAPGAPAQPMSILGTRGMVCDGRLLRFDGPPEDVGDGAEGLATWGVPACVTSFVDAIVDDAPVPIDGRDAFASLAACVAADESARTGLPVRPETLPVRDTS
jgi:predicted dehydrogenase